MSYGIELYDSSGVLYADVSTFGITLVDTIIVSSSSIGSRAFSNLKWHNKLWLVQSQEIPEGYSDTRRTSGAAQEWTYYSAQLYSFNSKNLSYTVDSLNVPTVHWSPDIQIGNAYNVIITVLAS